MSLWNVVASRSFLALSISTWLLSICHQTRMFWTSQRISWTTWRKTSMPVETHYSLVTSTLESMIPAAVTMSFLQNCLIVLGWLTISSLQHMNTRNTLDLIITSEREAFSKTPLRAGSSLTTRWCCMMWSPPNCPNLQR